MIDFFASTSIQGFLSETTHLFSLLLQLLTLLLIDTFYFTLRAIILGFVIILAMNFSSPTRKLMEKFLYPSICKLTENDGEILKDIAYLKADIREMRHEAHETKKLMSMFRETAKEEYEERNAFKDRMGELVRAQEDLFQRCSETMLEIRELHGFKSLPERSRRTRRTAQKNVKFDKDLFDQF